MMKIGEPITNICAGERNPHRLAYYGGVTTDSYRNKWGIVHKQRWIKCMGKDGKTWKTGPAVIVAGHLSIEESERLFAELEQLT